MVELRVGKLAWAREIEFRRDRNCGRGGNETRVGLKIFFRPELQHRIARTWQAAHEIRMNPKPGRHDFRSDILEFERGHKI
jgi:hypothetical protein